MIRLKNPKDLETPFDMVQFPSLGLFYEDKRAHVLVKYLTGIEENILTAPLLAATGEALNMALDRVIMDEGVDVNKLLIGDRNAILLYLRATSFGDNYTVIINCPKCGMSGDSSFNVSSMTAKDILEMPDETGCYTFTMPKMKIGGEPVVIKFRPLTVNDEQSMQMQLEFNRQIPRSKPKDITTKYIHQIVSINGIESKDYIAKTVPNFPIRDSSALRAYMERSEPGIDTSVTLKCKHCDRSFRESFEINSGFLGLTPEFKNTLWEENFLLWYYSQGGVDRSQTLYISTAERRWSIQRISEELNKKREAEEKASKAK